MRKKHQTNPSRGVFYKIPDQRFAKLSRSKQKINKETVALNDTLDQMDLTDIVRTFRTFHLETAEYTFFSSAHGTFSRINHILGHKSQQI